MSNIGSNILTLPSRTWLGIFAHPDDEWVAGWPVFQDVTLKKGVIFFTGNNGYGKDSTWKPVLIKLLNSLGIEFLGTLSLSPNFYQGSRHERRLLADRLAALLNQVCTGEFSQAAIITHNPVGEYGHPDHITVFNTVLQVSPHHEVYITDLCCAGQISSMHKCLFYNIPIPGVKELHIERWNEAVTHYRKALKWTGLSHPGFTKAQLYRLCQSA